MARLYHRLGSSPAPGFDGSGLTPAVPAFVTQGERGRHREDRSVHRCRYVANHTADNAGASGSRSASASIAAAIATTPSAVCQGEDWEAAVTTRIA